MNAPDEREHFEIRAASFPLLPPERESKEGLGGFNAPDK